MFLICVLHQEFRKLKGVVERAPVSNRQPVLYFDELVRSDGGPVPAEIIHFLFAVLSPVEPLNARGPSHPPRSQGVLTIGFDACLCLLHAFARSRYARAFYLCGELVYDRGHSGIGDPILGEREGQKATRDLAGCVYEYTSAHWTFDVFVPSSARSVKPGKEVLDHTECTEGVPAVWVGYSHGICDYLQT